MLYYFHILYVCVIHPACILLSCGVSSSFSCSHWSAGLNEEGEWERQRCDTMAWSWIQKRKYVSLEMLSWTQSINRPCVYTDCTLWLHWLYPMSALIVLCVYTVRTLCLHWSYPVSTLDKPLNFNSVHRCDWLSIKIAVSPHVIGLWWNKLEAYYLFSNNNIWF